MPAASRPQLVVLSGPHKGDVIVLDDPLPVVFGRRAGVSLPDAALSDVHCQVFQAGGRWYLQDFATPGGTWLGDERVEGARPLEPGRSFRIGETFVALLLPEQQAAAPPPPPPSPAVQEGVRAVDAAAAQARGWAPPPGPSTPPPGARPGRLDEAGKRRRRLEAKTDILPIEAPSPADDSDARPVRDLADTVELRTRRDDDDGGLSPHAALGDYDILKELGSGSLGRVYKAYDRRRKRVVAVKILSPDLAKDAQAVGRFLRGAQAGARLAHPNVCAIYGAGHTGGRIYVSMEYVEGLDLGAHVSAAGGHLPPRQAVAILGRVTDALVYAHARDVLHRNVSPRNVLVGDAGRTVKLVDLALAKRATAEKGLAITQSGQVLSQSPFAAPELLFDVQNVDHRADVYGVGATLFFALSGRPPYEGNLIDVAQRMQKGQHGDLRKLGRGPSKALIKLVERCLRSDPAERYPAARDLREAFAELPESAVE
ncbi:MAG: serine/threonine-protein kinase [Planctomycetes bacterium]|nr:serine/threonine-protein kinase [Planctomycetota bacterium]